MATMVSKRRSTFGVNCVQCDNELIAPEKSEFWNERDIRNLWRCPKCACCFATIVETESDIIIADDVLPSRLVA